MQDAIWFVRTEAGQVYGPTTLEGLKGWAQDGRVEPTGFVSKDRISWMPAQTLPELELKWLVEPEPGKVFGPFHRAFVSRLAKDGSLVSAAKIYRLHEFPIDEDPPPVEKIVEVPVEKIVEKRVEVPVEKIVEKIVEKRVEVPVEKIVEKIVEVEKVVEKRVEVPVPEPARTQLVVPEVVEPSGNMPPVANTSTVFKGLDREHLAALEMAARRELSKSSRFRIAPSFFGRKK